MKKIIIFSVMLASLFATSIVLNVDTPKENSNLYPKISRVEVLEIESETEEIEEVAVEEPATEELYSEETEDTSGPYWADPAYDGFYSSDDLRYSGAIYWNGVKFTYYSQRVLPGEGLDIPGRYVDEYGFVCDGDGYICLGTSNLSLPRGTIVMTLFGRPGKVYDYGYADEFLFDVYTDW